MTVENSKSFFGTCSTSTMEQNEPNNNANDNPAVDLVIKVSKCKSESLAATNKFQLVMAGDYGVGKTKFVARWARNEYIDNQMAIGIEFVRLTIY